MFIEICDAIFLPNILCVLKLASSAELCRKNSKNLKNNEKSLFVFDGELQYRLNIFTSGYLG